MVLLVNKNDHSHQDTYCEGLYIIVGDVILLQKKLDEHEDKFKNKAKEYQYKGNEKPLKKVIALDTFSARFTDDQNLTVVCSCSLLL